MKKTLFLFVFMLCLPIMSWAQQPFEINGVFTAVLTDATEPPVEKPLEQLKGAFLDNSHGFIYVVLDQAPTGTHYEWHTFAMDNSNVYLSGPTNSNYTCLVLSGTQTEVVLLIALKDDLGNVLTYEEYRFYAQNSKL